ncbi:MAG: ribonuclease HIII, partial [Streptococcus sanguinis]|nr:ribonuclease HIII [Streptococcus sanguinis]
MESITLSPKQQEIQAFAEKYQSQLAPNKNPHIQYFFRLDQATVSVF